MIQEKQEDSPLIFKNYLKLKIEAPLETKEFLHANKKIPEKLSYKGKEIDVMKVLQETHTQGLIVANKESILHESYYLGSSEYSKFNFRSGTSSFLSLIFGLLVEEGRVDTSNSVSFYIPELKEGPYENISVKNVLENTAGTKFYKQEIVDEIADFVFIDCVDYISKTEKIREPGKIINPLDPIPGIILGTIFQRVTKDNFSHYIQSNVWKPMGAEDYAFWFLGNNNEEVPFTFFHAGLRDYARIGALLLKEGGEIFPKEWVKKITEPQEKEVIMYDYYDNFDYGLQWVIPKDRTTEEFMAIVGSGGHYLYVNLDHEIIVVKTGADDFYTKNYPMNIELIRALSEYYGKK